VQKLLVLALIALVFQFSAHPALAGKGGKKALLSSEGPSIALNETDLSLGNSATFTVVYDTKIDNPRIEVLCYQDFVLVYGEAGSVDHTFVLGGAMSDWLLAGGSADCVANLFYFDNSGPEQLYIWLASTPAFSAAG
jgi:hypothetical protein